MTNDSATGVKLEKITEINAKAQMMAVSPTQSTAQKVQDADSTTAPEDD